MNVGRVQQVSDNRRFELLIEALSDYAIYMLDSEGFITSWNTGAQKIKGYNSVEIIGQHFSRFFIPEDQVNQLPETILAAARTDGRYESEGWRVRKDGSRFWANAILRAVRDEQGVLIGFAKITRDMTERVAAHTALLESERRFRILVDGVLDYAIYMLDPSGVVTNWNTGAERLKGYTVDEIVGQHFSKFYTKEDRAAGLPARVLETAAREGRYESEGWRIRKDGSRFWASVVVDAIRNKAGQLQGFAKVTRDVTERRAAHEALRQSERQFRLLVAGVTDYALFMLDPNGIVTNWNAGAQRIKGYAAEEIVGQHFSRFYTERDRAAGAPARALYTALREGRFEAEAWRVRKDGSMFWANVVIDAIRDEQGELVGFAKITRDITERRDAQIALQEAQTQRAHAQKMDALGQLTGGVAHDFNNLLMVVSGYIHTLKAKVADDPRAARAAEAIELAARRGESLTRQLLTFSRRQTFNPTVLKIGERVEALRIMLAGSIGRSVELVTTVGHEVWPVKVDANELELAIVNVALNARDAMPNGGIIAITAENATLSRGDTNANVEGEFVALHVADTGVGIAPDVLPKVFDPFFTTKQVTSGSGLGLSQVHGFVHQSGGTVIIDSKLGKGTTVTLYLPRTYEAADEAQAEPEAETAGDGTVLVVEDNPEVAGATVSLLEQLGYGVHTVVDADAALDVIGRQDFDLVISDIVMPGSMDGMTLARAIRERKPQLPVLLVTGYSHPAAKSGTEFTILRKPFQLADLSRTAARMIAQAKQPPTTNIVRLRDVRSSPPSRTDGN
ncbi:hybrid sensor histidine kinase/response regulator [Rhodospirillaceae bacterium SYSU D60014]|uniref:PAS domain S-box protein n=1 Tax=Virgifigura deserti TaxID=2268457 RepID=UPI0013C4F6F6